MARRRQKSMRKGCFRPGCLVWVLLLFFICAIFANDEKSNVTETAMQTASLIETESGTALERETEEENVPKQTDTPIIPVITETETIQKDKTKTPFSLQSVPKYSGKPYVVINDNVPFFSKKDYTTKSYEYYSSLDSMGRCGVTMACIGQDIMPTEKRGNIGSVKPTGWHTIKYDWIDGKYLYNRCHLIGYQLTAENANRSNLITGTRYLNVTGMLPFENMVADYIKETDNHVLYRVTPVFEGKNLVASGVLMEAMSMEDEGDDILFNVFCYNVQPGVSIDYATGSSKADGTRQADRQKETQAKNETKGQKESEKKSNSSGNGQSYVLNNNTKKFHKPSCSSADTIKPSNRSEFTGNREELINRGYDPCKRCHP